MTDRAVRLVGMTRKAGVLAVGASAVKRMMDDGRAKLVLATADSTDRARERWAESARRAGVPFAVAGDKDVLGAALGRQSVAVVAVVDSGFASALLDELQSLT